jgi:hypothetical protein
MDSEALVSEFQSIAYGNKPSKELIVVKEEKPPKKFNFPLKNAAAGVVFLLVVFWGGNYLLNYLGEKGTVQPPSVQQPQVQQNDQSQNNQAQNNQEQNNQAQQPVTDKLVLDIEAKENCWLKIAADGSEQYIGIMVPSEKKTITASQSIVMTAGNAGGVDLTLNSIKQAPLGERGQVVEKQFDFNSITKE